MTSRKIFRALLLKCNIYFLVQCDRFTETNDECVLLLYLALYLDGDRQFWHDVKSIFWQIWCSIFDRIHRFNAHLLLLRSTMLHIVYFTFILQNYVARFCVSIISDACLHVEVNTSQPTFIVSSFEMFIYYVYWWYVIWLVFYHNAPVCGRACVRACVRACLRVCICVCLYMCVCVGQY